MSIFGNLKEKLARNIEDKIDAVKLNFIDKTSGVLGSMFFGFIAIFLLLAVLIFLGVGLTEVFSELCDSRPAGAFITAGIYLLLLAGLFAFRKQVLDKFAGIFIRILTTQQDEDEEEDKEDK